MPNPSNKFLRQFLLPVIVSVGLIAGIICGLLMWSTARVDGVAHGRQRQIMQSVLVHAIAAIAHDQESSTVWDDAVLRLRAPTIDRDWLDNNLGIWLNSYYGHDDAYIVDPAGRPIYAMHHGKRGGVRDFNRVSAQAVPLIAELRAKLAYPHPDDVSASVLTPGSADIAIVEGRPSIISVKPIVPDTDAVAKGPGEPFLHISVRHLDGAFLTALSKEYAFADVRFSWTGAVRAGETAVPLQSRLGGTIGYIAWRPFAPGAQVWRQTAPALGIALAAVALIVAALLARIRVAAIALTASEAQAQHLAFHDALTGLANRALFEDRLEHALALARRGGAVALIYVDLDDFKSVNDRFGHPVGDALIREVGRRLLAQTRETDTVARLGGDEFAVIQLNATGSIDPDMMAGRIVAALAGPFELGGAHVVTGASVGVAIAPRHGLDRVELSRKADIALYAAKRDGRGRHVVFASAMDASIRHRQKLESDLRAALTAGDQFALHYQPLYNARNGAMTGVEALLRWHHPTQGMMAPANFIPIAEECGLIDALGEWVLRQACMEARDWPLSTVAVNLSAAQLRNPHLAERVMAIVSESGIDPRRLELEITETSFIENAADCAPNIARLREQGIRIALDDFGTGYSSFNHLRQFDVDRLKIDRSFVNGIDPRASGSPIIRAIVDLAHSSGITVTAEGVETATQRDWLTAIGCDTLQGYLLARPMPAADIATAIRATRAADAA